MGIITLGIFVSWNSWINAHTSGLSREFYELVEKSEQKELDLRSIQSVDWDELAYWYPYGDICDFKIEGYAEGGSNCIQSIDDGEAYLLFLKNNELIGKVRIQRSKTDFNDQIGRVKRENAVFSFSTKGDFPKVILKLQR